MFKDKKNSLLVTFAIISFLFFLISSTILSSSQSPVDNLPLMTIVATFEGGEISLGEVEREWNDFPDKYNNKLDALNHLINVELIVKKAQELGLDKDEEVQNRIKTTTEQIQQEATEKSKNSTEQILIQNLIKQEIDDRLIKLTEEEIARYYKENKEEFYIPDMYNLQEIVVEMENEAKTILKEIKSGSDFNLLAQEKSIGLTAKKGGYLGYVTIDSAKLFGYDDFKEIASALKIGEVSKVIKTEKGYCLLKLLEIKPAYQETLEKTKRFIERKLSQERRENAYSEWLNNLKEQARIQVAFNLAEITEEFLSSKPSETVLVSFRGGEITLEEFNKSWEDPDHKNKYKTKEKLLENILKERILVQRARETGLEEDENVSSQIKTAIEQIRKEREEKVKISTQQALIDVATKVEIYDKVKLSEEEIAKYYKENKEDFIKNEEYHLHHILVESQEEAEAILEKIKGGTDFVELAKERSLCPSGEKGGDLGFVARGRTVNPFEDAAFTLRPGEISEVVKTQFGYHIIKLEEISPERQKTLEEAKTEIEFILLPEMQQQAFTRWLSSLRDEAQVQIKEELLR
ncbi:MAG: peptidyl-prolyl cis-trans isomerase [Candidatus Atribacteria bacterium]|nr:peptidyl-prolyl cis-trans isomerase [Candidatus Atribacteria bacterium]